MDRKYKIDIIPVIAETEETGKIYRIYKKRIRSIGLLIIKLVDENGNVNGDFILSKYKIKLAKLIKRIDTILKTRNDHGLMIILENSKKIYTCINENFTV